MTNILAFLENVGNSLQSKVTLYNSRGASIGYFYPKDWEKEICDRSAVLAYFDKNVPTADKNGKRLFVMMLGKLIPVSEYCWRYKGIIPPWSREGGGPTVRAPSGSPPPKPGEIRVVEVPVERPPETPDAKPPNIPGLPDIDPKYFVWGGAALVAYLVLRRR